MLAMLAVLAVLAVLRAGNKGTQCIPLEDRGEAKRLSVEIIVQKVVGHECVKGTTRSENRTKTGGQQSFADQDIRRLRRSADYPNFTTHDSRRHSPPALKQV
jgi:hypothetical protein